MSSPAEDDDDRWYVVVITDRPDLDPLVERIRAASFHGPLHEWRQQIEAVLHDAIGSFGVLSRRQHGDAGPFTGPWAMLTEEEATALAVAFNDDPREGGTAHVAEVYRFDADPVWADNA